MLCGDEKSQVQALDRTQPGLPLKKGRAQTMTHDDKRHGTTTLFAALNVLDGRLTGRCQQRHTHVEWLKFLRQIDRDSPSPVTPGLPGLGAGPGRRQSPTPRPASRVALGCAWLEARCLRKSAAGCSVADLKV